MKKEYLTVYELINLINDNLYQANTNEEKNKILHSHIKLKLIDNAEQIIEGNVVLTFITKEGNIILSGNVENIIFLNE